VRANELPIPSGSAWPKAAQDDDLAGHCHHLWVEGGPMTKAESSMAVGEALRLLSDLFSEAAHEHWTKGEVVQVIEDFIKVRCPDTRPDREGK